MGHCECPERALDKIAESNEATWVASEDLACDQAEETTRESVGN